MADVTAIVVTCRTPDLTSLALRSLQRFAPSVLTRVVETGGAPPLPVVVAKASWDYPGAVGGAADHAGAIEWVRETQEISTPYVLLFDSDCLVTSRAWLPRLLAPFENPRVGAVGGLRSFGSVCQVHVGERVILHANCLLMRQEVFRKTTSFAAGVADAYGVVALDTAHRVSLEADQVHALPFFPFGTGPRFGNLTTAVHEAIAEYFDPLWGRETLWAHLGRGTSGRAPRWRQWGRALKAACGGRSSKKLLMRDRLQQGFLARSRAILEAA